MAEDHRVEDLERRVAELERTLNELTVVREVAPSPARTPDVARTPEPAPVETREPAPSPSATAPRSGAPLRSRKTMKPEDLLGPRALAWVGGSVLLLGIAFFLAIAVDRGWIGEETRVVLGALLSATLMGVAFRLRSKFGRMEAGLVAAGVSIGGFLLTILAAGSLYEILPQGLCVALILAVATGSIWLALEWSNEGLAVTGVGGAIGAVPVLIETIDLNCLLALALLVAFTAVLASRCGWTLLSLTALAGTSPQVIYWLGADSAGAVSALAVAAGFAGLYLVSAYELWARESGEAITPGSFLLVPGAAAVLLAAVLIKLTGEAFGLPGEGLGVAGLAIVFAALGAAMRADTVPRTASGRDLSSILWGIGTAFLGLAEVICFQDLPLVIAFGVSAMALALLAQWTGEQRLTLVAILFFGAQIIYVVCSTAPPSLLFDDSAMPGGEVVTVIVAALTAAVIGALRIDPLPWRPGLISAAFIIYGCSLVIVAVLNDPSADIQVLGTASTSFQRAHTVVSIFWGVIGFGAMLVGLRRHLQWLRLAGLALLGLALAKAFLFDLSYLTTFARALTFLGLGALLLAAAFFQQRLGETAPAD